jgi:hypothetical protein
MAEWLKVTDFNTEGLRRSQMGVTRGLSFAGQHGLGRLPFARAERCVKVVAQFQYRWHKTYGRS